MTDTYSLNMLGTRVSRGTDGEFAVMPDALAQSLGTTTRGRNGTSGLSVSPVGMPYGGFKLQASHGDIALCKTASGLSRYFKIDAERSDPAKGLIYLLPV